MLPAATGPSGGMTRRRLGALGTAVLLTTVLRRPWVRLLSCLVATTAPGAAGRLTAWQRRTLGSLAVRRWRGLRASMWPSLRGGRPRRPGCRGAWRLTTTRPCWCRPQRRRGAAHRRGGARYRRTPSGSRLRASPRRSPLRRRLLAFGLRCEHRCRVMQISGRPQCIVVHAFRLLHDRPFRGRLGRPRSRSALSNAALRTLLLRRRRSSAAKRPFALSRDEEATLRRGSRCMTLPG